MHTSALALFIALSVPVLAADSSHPSAEPKVLLKMIGAMEASKIDALVSKRSEDGITYHLQEARFLGTVVRDSQTFTVAQVHFVRSSPAGKEKLPARGHDFIVIFDAKFKIVGHAPCGYERYSMQGDKLILGDKTIADFQSRDESVRREGFLIESGMLPYPFSDRITEPNQKPH